ncbi:MAG: WD40/YVTN/BNR-like repeat-containing protein [Candidatus Dormibacteria bacterium]
MDARGRETLFDSSPPGLVRSDDLGDSWRVVGPQGTPTVAPAFARDGAVAVAAPRDYLLKGTVAAAVEGSGGKLLDQAFAFGPDPAAASGLSDRLLVGADSASRLPIIQQCDASLTCSGSATLPGASTFSLPVTLYPSSSFERDRVVFAQSGRGIYKSNDGGRTFDTLTVGASDATATSTPMLALDSRYRELGPNRTLVAAVFQVFGSRKPSASGGGVYRSLDGGQSWTSLTAGTPLEAGASAVALAPDGRIFAGFFPSRSSHAGLLCSTNGDAWNPSCAQGTGGTGTALALPWLAISALVGGAGLVVAWTIVRPRARSHARAISRAA